jgi:amino-acid N-acetyltransferase
MIRKANLQDVKAIHHLLHEYGKKEELLARPLSQLYDHVRDFSVHLDNNSQQLTGCCALQICWEDLAEIRSLAVHPDHQGKNIGRTLTETVLQEAKLFQVKKVFTLTYKPDFFKQFGFVTIERSDLPLKIWGDCIICVKFPDCDETAMMKEL